MNLFPNITYQDNESAGESAVGQPDDDWTPVRNASLLANSTSILVTAFAQCSVARHGGDPYQKDDISQRKEIINAAEQ